MTKRIITKTEFLEWLDKIQGKTIAEAEKIIADAKAKYGDAARLECEFHDYHATSCIEVTREETDDEYNLRLKREGKLAEENLSRERREFERLSVKFANEEKKPQPLPYNEWCKLTGPVYEPFIASLGNSDVFNNFLLKKYAAYIATFRLEQNNGA